MTDPIADMLSRIRNAIAARKQSVALPHSRLKKSIADILQREGYIDAVEVEKTGSFQELKLTLKYDTKHSPFIRNLKRVSKPGCRSYVATKDIPTVLNNYGILILSTSQGVITNVEAKKLKVGGEVLCEIS